MDLADQFVHLVRSISDQLTVIMLLVGSGIVFTFTWWRDDIVLGSRHRAAILFRDGLIQEKEKENQFLRESIVRLYESQEKLADYINKKEGNNV